jgi:hypothetical protein
MELAQADARDAREVVPKVVMVITVMDVPQPVDLDVGVPVEPVVTRAVQETVMVAA